MYIGLEWSEEKEKMKNEIMSLFSTPVVKINIGRDFTKDEINYISNIPMTKIGTIKRKKGQESLKTTLFKDSPNLKNIKSFCEYHIKQYLKHIEGVDTNLVSLRITESWLNKNKPGESHHSHHHPNSYLSGVFYFNCLPNDHINIINRLDRMYTNMRFQTERITDWNANRKTINVKEGDLIIFPSWVTHGVSPNETKDTERISLAFNTFPVDEMKNGDWFFAGIE
jgi:uncharacterized protein (TIGR02466 family)